MYTSSIRSSRVPSVDMVLATLQLREVIFMEDGKFKALRFEQFEITVETVGATPRIIQEQATALIKKVIVNKCPDLLIAGPDARYAFLNKFQFDFKEVKSDPIRVEEILARGFEDTLTGEEDLLGNFSSLFQNCSHEKIKEVPRPQSMAEKSPDFLISIGSLKIHGYEEKIELAICYSSFAGNDDVEIHGAYHYELGKVISGLMTKYIHGSRNHGILDISIRKAYLDQVRFLTNLRDKIIGNSIMMNSIDRKDCMVDYVSSVESKRDRITNINRISDSYFRSANTRAVELFMVRCMEKEGTLHRFGLCN